MNLNESTTNNINIIVESRFESALSRPSQRKFIHAYFVTIHNKSDRNIKLLRREWKIQDAENKTKHVEGEGVIGEQPILNAGQQYSYKSWSPIATPIGQMSGKYLMMDLETSKEFWVDIPRFDLIAPFKLN